MDIDSASESELWEAVGKNTGGDKLEVLIELANRNLAKGDFNKVISCAGPAIELAEELHDHEKLPVANYFYGAALANTEDLENALEYLNKSSDGFRANGDERLLGLAIYEIAETQIALGQPDAAEEAFVSALNILSSNGNVDDVVRVGRDFGEFLGGWGKQSHALEIFQKTKQFAQQLENPLLVARIDDRIAACLIELARGDEALDYLKSVLDVVSYAGGKSNIAWAQYRYGWTLQTFGYRQQAIRNLEQAKILFKELDDIKNHARCDFQIAHCLSGLGEYREAADLYMQLEEVFKSIGSAEFRYLCSANLAYMYFKAQDYERAKDHYEKLLNSLPEDSYGSIRRWAIISLSNTLIELECFSEALTLIEQIDTAEFGDNQLDRFYYVNGKARALVCNGRSSEGESLLAEIFSSDLSHGLEATYANALETLAIIAHLKGDEKEMAELRGKAIAYYLAGDELNDARRLAEKFRFTRSTLLDDAMNPKTEMTEFKFGFSLS